MVLCDAVLRKLPGALGHEHSAVEESFSAALEGHPEYPHYTRPAEYRGWRVPEVLLSGHHERIERWRRERSRERGAGAVGPRRALTAAPRRRLVSAERADRPLPLLLAPAETSVSGPPRSIKARPPSPS